MSIEEASREISDTLRHATALHQTGRLDEAERLYRQVLQAAPDQAEALQFHSFPLFDTPRFARYIEEGYRIMWERSERGLPPASFVVERGQP